MPKGVYQRKPKDHEACFWARVQKSEGCWLWTGAKNRNGYGYLGMNNKDILAHRFSWIVNVGEIRAGKCVLHRCDVPACVRPDHLFVGDHLTNVRDCIAKGRRFTNHKQAARTKASRPFCRRGHEYAAVGFFVGNRGQRRCKACAADDQRGYRSRKASAS